MKKVCILITLFLNVQLYAQEVKIVPASKFEPAKAVSYDDFFDVFGTALNLTAENSMIAHNTNSQNKNSHSKHVKYKQYYKGIEVYGVAYTLHGDGHKVQYGTGTYLPNLNIDVQNPTTSTEAEAKAIRHIIAKSAKPFTKFDKQKIWLSEVIGPVIIDRNFPDISGEYTLAFKIHVSAKGEAIKHEVIISANDHKVVFDQSLVKHGHADGIGKTFYYGNQKITTDSIAPDQFVLRDLTRGEGITTYTMSSGIPQLLTDKNNVWDDEEANDLVAIDAHWTTSMFYDMMLDSFDYSGLDGMGKSMNPVVFYGGMKNFINAFWDGDNAYFGQGDCHNGPLTTLTVVAHEFTHGVTQYNSDLIYSGESGALNESMSDLFGKALDIYVRPKDFSWDLGPDFSLSPFSELFRSFSDPNKVGHPKKYKGYLWEEDADVHTNSSIMNHWFYLLVEGIKGENEGTFYDIQKMDMTDLLKVVFLCQTSYLTPTSGYQEMYEFTLLACAELYGDQSSQYQSIKEAWKAVGLPFIEQPGPIVDLGLEIIDPYSFTCAEDQYYPLTIIIHNRGNTIVNKSEELVLTSFNLDPKQIYLSNNLAPGESEKIEVKDWLNIAEFGLIFEDITLEFLEDQYLGNNSQFIYIQQFESENNDLKLAGFAAIKETCFSNTYKLNIALENVSCQFFPPDQPIKITLSSNGTVLKTLDLLMESFLFPGDTKLFNEEVVLQNFVDIIDVKFETALDVNSDNNKFTTSLTNLPVSSAPFLYGFDDDSFENSFDVSYSLDYTTYQNEDYLVATSSGSSAVPCPKIKDNFVYDSFSESTSYIQTCLDLSSFESTELSFDMIQFRSGTLDNYNDPSLSAMTSVLKYELIGENGKEEKYFFNLPIGQKNNQKISIPEGFKGLVRLGFYNNFGLGYFSSIITNRIDAILLDNLKLEQISSLDDIRFGESVLKIIPNPASDLIILNDLPLNSAYIITSANGSVVQEGVVTNDHFDISFLPSGYYLLQIKSNGFKQVGSFVKL